MNTDLSVESSTHGNENEMIIPRIPKDYCKICVILLAVMLGYKEALVLL